jgi:hypothetical protein
VSACSEQLARVLELHFDPRWGSPYWLARGAALGFDPRREIRDVADLPRLGPLDLDDLAQLPVEAFVPRALHSCLHEFVTCETGGTTGAPKRTVFSRGDFAAAFVTPFVRAADRVGFPRDRAWLFVGPSGPHAIGKAARACAQAFGSIDPFSVDFDPRWARKLPPDSLARRRYLEHVLEQARGILQSQQIGVIFATPPVLEALGTTLPAERREAVEGIHLGGMAVAPDFGARLAEWFPRALCLAGYGNSLAGVCPQLRCTSGEAPEYFPHGSRLVLEIAEPAEDGRGRVRFHRLDESGFLPNVLERDEAAPAAPPADAVEAGFVELGVRDPRPPAARGDLRDAGLY